MRPGIRNIILMTALWLLAGATAFAADYDVSEGYDENTELTFRGTVKEIVTGQRGPVIAVFKGKKKEYAVITAPPWFLEQEGVTLQPGASYEIKGSKYIGRDGNLYLIARSLKNLSTGKITVLRDESNHPLWGGHHRMRRGHGPR